MSRKPRIDLEDAIYHVIQRGNNRDYIFNRAADKSCLLNIIQDVKQELPFHLLGFVIMDNHYHLMVKRDRVPLFKVMQRINNKYSKYYNKQHSRTGHVFEGRYTGILVKDDKYLLSLLRYIHQNPVQAHICTSVRDYRWSSDYYYRNNLVQLTAIDLILNTFSADRRTALEEYDLFMEMEEPLDKDFFEGKETIEDIEQVSTAEKAQYDQHSLDEILRGTGVGEADFCLIKEGSRMRHLRDYKVRYAKEAIQSGYTMKAIGININVSAEAINKMV